MSSNKNNLSVKCLQVEDIPDFLELQQSLPRDQKNFVKPRQVTDLQAHLEAPMPMIGVYENNQLVAGALLTFPKHLDMACHLEAYPFNPAQQTTAVLQAVVCQKRGTLSHIVEAAKDLALMHGHTQLMAKVHEQNTHGLKGFAKRGFENYASGRDPKQGYPVRFMRACLQTDPGIVQVESLELTVC